MNKKFKTILLVIMICVTIIFLSILLINKYTQKKLNPDGSLLIKLYLSQEDKVIQLPLEEYVAGTVAAEMPASFELEALKAQAVCARTYALRKIIDKHKYPKGADLSDNIAECQAYISSSEFIQRHQKEIFLEKIVTAVNATQGEIITYNNEPIDALYHSTCGGYTESAVNAWANEIPYLQSVKCNYCSKSRFYSTVQVFSAGELNNLKTVSDIDSLDIKILKKTPAGRIKKIKINDISFSGEEIRKTLNLPSNWWSFKKRNDELIITNHGYGHGVGMCQYGANGMAKEGKNYKEILKKYYQNIEFIKINYIH